MTAKPTPSLSLRAPASIMSTPSLSRSRSLAKKSWGWIAHDIPGAGAAGDLSWKRRRRDRRDPRDYVRGTFSALSGGAAAEIRNRLDYALDACPPAAVAEALDAATKRLEHNVLNHIESASA